MKENILDRKIPISTPWGTTTKKLRELDSCHIYYCLSDADKSLLLVQLIERLREYDY